MYHKHRTEALVLEAQARGEADAQVKVLTGEFGLLEATVKSLRKERSRLRYALQRYTLLDLTLVRGKREWRVAGAQDRIAYGTAIQTPRARLIRNRVCRLALRMVGKEDRRDARSLLIVMQEGLAALALYQAEESARLDVIEALWCLRLLYDLGYVSLEQPARYAALCKTERAYAPETISEALVLRRELTRTINESLRATGL